MERRTGDLKIHTYPDPVLRARAEELKDIDENTLLLIDKMIEIMYAAPGIGLAANQVGDLNRIIVFDRAPDKEGRSPFAIINPEVVNSEGQVVYEEACLSVIDFSADVSRSERVKVRGLDRDGNPVDFEAEGLLSICLQHEIDHLNGTLFIDHLSSLKRSMYKKKLKKILKREE
ncbi:peptide deformylase [Thermodesulfobacteriota bacterium]